MMRRRILAAGAVTVQDDGRWRGIGRWGCGSHGEGVDVVLWVGEDDPGAVSSDVTRGRRVWIWRPWAEEGQTPGGR
jgi:hypothetical protein